MLAVLHALGTFIFDLLKSRRRLQAENLFLRHQLNIALRGTPPRRRLHGSDRALLVWMTRICPELLTLAQVVKPETILRWHRAGFKAFWRWKSCRRSGVRHEHLMAARHQRNRHEILLGIVREILQHVGIGDERG